MNNRNYNNSGFPYKNQSYQNGHFPQNQQGQKQWGQAPPKKSGAVYSKITKGNYVGKTIVNAWNKSRSRGLITCTVSPYKNSKQVTSKNGHTYQTMIAVVKYHNTGVEKVIPVLMNQKSQVISISDIGMVISPNGKGVTSGGKRVTGYFGTFSK